MSNKQIHDLPAGSAIDSTSIFESEESGVSVYFTGQHILDYITSDYTGSSAIVSTGEVISGTWYSAIKKRVKSITSNSSISVNADTDDLLRITALAANTTIANPTGTPTEGKYLEVRVTTTLYNLQVNFGTNYRFSSDLPNPSPISATCTTYYKFEYNASATKWDCVLILSNIT